MAIGYLIVGVISGLCSAGFLLLTGNSILQAFVAYSVVGTLSYLLIAAAFALRRSLTVR